MPQYWTKRFAARNQHLTSSPIRELLKLTQRPEIISFAGGLPAAELFPIDAFQQASERLLSQQGQLALQYSTTQGYLPLREMIARHGERYGLRVGPENILITSGSQQALDLLGRLMIDRGDRVLIERPSYLGALQAFSVYGPEFVSLPLDEDGVQVNGLAAALNRPVKYMYILPNFHNPGGVTLSQARREQLVASARRSGVPIIEDDPYGQLRYEGDHVPTLYSLDQELAASTGSGSSNVIYVSSFSKVLAPGLRLAWVIGPAPLVERLELLKQAADLHTSTYCQMLAYEVSRGGFLDEHIRTLRAAYRERRDAMLAALEAHFQPGIHWTRPQGGLFLWLTLPAGLDSEVLLQAALEQNVAFVPGSAFYADGDEGRRHCRLNFSCMPPDRIEEGIRRLAGVIESELPQRVPA